MSQAEVRVEQQLHAAWLPARRRSRAAAKARQVQCRGRSNAGSDLRKLRIVPAKNAKARPKLALCEHFRARHDRPRVGASAPAVTVRREEQLQIDLSGTPGGVRVRRRTASVARGQEPERGLRKVRYDTVSQRSQPTTPTSRGSIGDAD